MAKHILDSVDGFKKRGDVFRFDPRKIVVVDGWNPRTDFSCVADLKESIKQIGVQSALIVRKSKTGIIELVDGECRLRATLEAISDGCEIESVPVMVENSKVSEPDLLLRAVVANTGTPLKPSEEAAAFKRFVAWGWSIKEIAQKVGRSQTLVRNRLDLNDAIPAVKKAVDDKQITAVDAKEIIKEADGKVESQEKILEVKKAQPKEKKCKPLRLFFKAGQIVCSGGEKDQVCRPVADLMVDGMFRAEIEKAGYDPNSIVINISKKQEE